ncbi:MAG: helix-turn-helix transcriptional regulator [Cruoricaptor ignavus]|nr:helix-turn-helix transcriptional regulator [Cruoricaptor ignavus]
MELGEILRHERLNRNFSQDYMAEMLNVSQKTYSNFENNKTKPNFEQIEKIAQVLEISILNFLSDSKISNNSKIKNDYMLINVLSEQLIEQYELRIKKLEEDIEYFKLLLDKFTK